MAQVGQSVPRREKLLRKGGLKPGGKVVLCLAVLVVAAIIGGFVLVGWPFGGEAGSSFEIQRNEEVAGAVGETQAAVGTSVVEDALPNKVVVHIDGQVAAPGVYELVEGEARVNDAILAAGGLTADADTLSLNLASKVADGQKIYVPAVGEQQVAAEGSGVVAASGGVASSGGGLININLATVDELQVLSGVGEATAKAIVEDRQNNGQFTCVEDLMRVSGIGEKKFEKIRDRICV